MRKQPFQLSIFRGDSAVDRLLSARFTTPPSASGYSEIELFGSYKDSVSLLHFQGGFIQFSATPPGKDEPSIEGLGRLSFLSMTFGNNQPDVVYHICTILISKIIFTDIYGSQRIVRQEVIYSLQPRLSRWPDKHNLMRNYDGTISEFANKDIFSVSVLGLRIEVSRYYYYPETVDDAVLIQEWLPSFTIRRGARDVKRSKPEDDQLVLTILIIVLSFYHGVFFSPVRKYVADNQRFRRVYWPAESIKFFKREFEDFSLHPEFAREYIEIASANISSGVINLDRLTGIVGRFCEASQAQSFEPRLTYLTEAIEGIISLAGLRSSQETDRSTDRHVTTINKYLKKLSTSQLDYRPIRAQTLLPQTAWDTVKRIMLYIYGCNDNIVNLCLSRGRFFSIRNEIVHQGKDASDPNLFLQCDIAAYIFKSLFLYVVGCSDIRAMPGLSLRYAADAGIEDAPETVTMWE